MSFLFLSILTSRVSRCCFAELVSSAGHLELLPSGPGRRPHGVCMSAHPLLHLPCCAFDWALDSFWFCFWGIWDKILF